MNMAYKSKKGSFGLGFPGFLILAINLLLPHESAAKVKKPEMPAVQYAQQALCSSYAGFSYDRLIENLIYKGYSKSEAETAVANCGADWNEQACIAAKRTCQTAGALYN